MTTSPTSALIASVIARKSSTSYDGVPSGRRAWMWMWTPPSSTIRRASAAYSSGVYGMAGHWSRLASAPEMAQVMTTGSSRLTLVLRGKWDVPLPTLSHRTRQSKYAIAGYYAAMIGAIILGIVAGFIARALMPGRDPMGFLATIILGLAGALVGVFIFTELLGIGDNQAFDLGGLIGAVIGSMLLLLLYRRFVGYGDRSGRVATR